jgi:hypothetical protein
MAYSIVKTPDYIAPEVFGNKDMNRKLIGGQFCNLI